MQLFLNTAAQSYLFWLYVPYGILIPYPALFRNSLVSSGEDAALPARWLLFCGSGFRCGIAASSCTASALRAAGAVVLKFYDASFPASIP